MSSIGLRQVYDNDNHGDDDNDDNDDNYDGDDNNGDNDDTLTHYIDT